MAISALTNTLVSRRLFRVAQKTDSLALEADALHLSTDVYTSVGVFVGLLIIRITGFELLDPAIAILVALLIFKAAYDIIKRSLASLMDQRLPHLEEGGQT